MRQGKCQEEKKKVLLVTTVSGFVPQFEMGNVRILQELGYEVHYASNFKNPGYGEDNTRLYGTGIICHQIDMERSPFRILKLYKAYCQLKKLVEEIHFELLHCHTPVGGALARLAAWRTGDWALDADGRNPFVIYTAHGFHFFKGAPWLYWLLYYPAERLLAHKTDVLITINEEDYRRAGKFRFRNRWQKKRKFREQTEKRENRKKRKEGKRSGVFQVNGVGIDFGKYRFTAEERRQKRKELGVEESTFLLLSVGELSKRKNHQVVIRALAKLVQEEKEKSRKRRDKKQWMERQQDEKQQGNKQENKEQQEQKMPGQWKYFIAGKGSEQKHLEQCIRKKHLEKQVTLLGYRKDVRELLAAADGFVFPSKQEGLPVALMEALAAGLPCIAADIRGCRELLGKESLVKENTVEEYCRTLSAMYRKWKNMEIAKGFVGWQKEKKGTKKERKKEIKQRAGITGDETGRNRAWESCFKENQTQKQKKISKENVEKQMRRIYEMAAEFGEDG